jgi:hypothetical protein
MAAGLFIVHSQGWICWFRSFSSDWLTSIWHEQLVHLSQLVWQQTIESIFQLQGALPNWLRLTHALALAAAAQATLG